MKVYVGMSGGVDSSLAAALLVEEGYQVIGVYMKNWTRDLPGMKCPWADDLADAKRVAVQLGIDLKVFDFEKEYKQKVVDYMINEYKAGRTPNPDIMCNQEVKFKLFLDAALEDGADMIATGHYARVTPDSSARSQSEHTLRVVSDQHVAFGSPAKQRATVSDSKHADESTSASLRMAVDNIKDQTYFLYRVSGEALGKTLFPIGEYKKSAVRQMAKERGLLTADKKDSQGICFVGQIGIRDFLSEYVDTKPGRIIDKHTNEILGQHDGAIFYTLGQRHGLELGGGLPYYIVGKNMDKNEVYVTRDLNDDSLWKTKVSLSDLHWINDAPPEKEYQIRIRHRAPLAPADLVYHKDSAELSIKQPQRAVSPGQSIVIYDGDICLGGGIVV